jgi:glutamate dehydrogenase
MAIKAADTEAEVIDAICERIRERLPDEEAGPCQSFVRQYYHWVPAADLKDRDSRDLYGAAVAHWKLTQHRAPGEMKVHVYNPDSERDGWSSPHTIVELVTDDMPFLVDSVTMELNRQGYGIDLVIHPVMWIRRDREGNIVELLDPETVAGDTNGASGIAESVLHVEVVREPESERLEELEAGITRVLGDVEAAVRDWGAMRTRMIELAEELEDRPPPIDEDEVREVKAFLGWLTDDHFTFLGYREYKLVDDGGAHGLTAVDGSGLGILSGPPATPMTELSAKALALAKAPHLLVLTKATSRATVHRPAYLDYVGVRMIDDDGKVTGERRFLGLYTSAAYKQSPLDIPLLRGKVKEVLRRAAFPPASHDAKALLEILETYPRDSLFQIDGDELFDIAIGILGLGERQRLRLFARRDPLDRFMACMVCVPRDRFNTENRERIGALLLDVFGGSQLDWTLHLTESLLARVHYIVHLPPDARTEYDLADIEARLVQATRAWTDDLRDELTGEHGEDDASQLYKRYRSAFPAAYRDDWKAASAVGDIARLEELSAAGGLIITLYRPREATGNFVRCKLYSASPVLLSDVLPTFENMGTRVVDEHPYEITPADSESLWVYDFGLECPAEDIESVRDAFQETFLGVWRGEFENDRFNALVVHAGLEGREIRIIRAIAKYLRQAPIAFSDRYMEETLLAHPDIAALLVRMFIARFDPDNRDPEGRAAVVQGLEQAITHAIDEVVSLDQDRILRSFLSIVQAILRTNYFRLSDDGRSRPFLSFKLDPEKVPILPLPRPRFEIFVYSPRVEGVHLRGGKVARGGLRWSDRREDFRTEVLGLMKAQMVKNALIVPVGSKGGFVVKRPPAGGGREALLDEGIACYKTFLSGLLDLTDNIADGEVVPPPSVVRYDEDDPYLVVAADKGTATFSDIANGISADYGFWLGDAFASGGSQGYDHKAMGITARGAWESVKRHFRELGTDIQTTDFTVCGIGDMAGDVFGNGMLLSEHIRLIAAFNHLHIFLDPQPDAAASCAERRRLFDLPRSSWSDYDTSLISAGGGVYERSAKSIPISEEVREALAIDDEELTPTDLIQAILRAPVDLLWNGGIGTYVKASTETHGDVGDKANDVLRVDAPELRCRVVGEGGNLGFTQRGRIEYALAGGPDGSGGRINTDAIDNVAGVNTSDHEVNIKILLDSLVHAGEMTDKERNELLGEMTDAVAERVLYGSYTQTQALSLALAQAPQMIDVHQRLIRHLEQVAGLKRKVEFLPSDDMLAERKAAHQGLVSPEMAVVMAYCKIHLYAELLETDLPEDPYLSHDLERYFPSPLPERYAAQMREHRLRREIIATVVANQLVDRAGTTFAFRLGEETGAPASILARAYAVAREVFEMQAFWEAIEALDSEVETDVQLEMLIEGRRLVERATRWLARANPGSIDIADTARYYKPGTDLLRASIPDLLASADRQAFTDRVEELTSAGVPESLAQTVASMPSLLPAFDVVEVAGATGKELEDVLRTYFLIGSKIELTWLRDRIIELPRANRWQALARAALRDDLNSLHRALTQDVLEAGGSAEEALEAWTESHRAELDRCLAMLADVRASREFDTTTLPVALREVRNLIRAGTSADEAAEIEPVTMPG